MENGQWLISELVSGGNASSVHRLNYRWSIKGHGGVSLTVTVYMVERKAHQRSIVTARALENAAADGELQLHTSQRSIITRFP